MAYKFQRGPAVASGSFTAEEGLTATTGGLTVSAGTVSLPAASVATAALAASSVTVGSTSISLGSTATSLDGLTTVDTTNIEVTNIKAKDGTAAVTVADTTGHVTITNLTGTSVDINGGTIDGTAIGASSQSSVKATTLSASSTLQVGALTTLNGGLSVTLGGATITGSTTITGSGGLLNLLGGNFVVNGGNISGSQAIRAGTSITASAGVLVNDGGVIITAGGLAVNAGDTSLQKLTVNGDLIVLGNTFSASVGTLLIEDAAIVIGDGSTAFGTGYGINFGSGSNQWATLLTAQANIDGIAGNENVLSSSLAIKAPAFAGTLYGTMASPVTLVADAGTLAIGVNYFANVAGASSVTLPAAPSVGESVRVKAPSNCNTTNTITINKAGSQTIDAEDFIVLESSFAAVEFVYVAENLWRIF